MNILEFNKRFPNEQTCKDYLKDLRLNQGIVCNNCNTITKHWWLNKVEKFQCSVCNSRTNLKSGTIMEKSQISILIWFMCIHLMTTTKKPFSSLEMKRQLGFNRYEPVWEMMNKIRVVMGKRDNEYQLKGDMEVDEGFFEVVNLSKKDELGNIIDEDLKRGRGSQDKMKVLVMVESNEVEQEKDYKKNRKLGYVKMKIMDSLTSDDINYEIKKSVNKNSHIFTDGYRGYNNLRKIVNNHTKMIVKPKECMKKLPWVHTVISNCKRELTGVHHSIGKEYLQNYLDEFCYKLNRRNFIYRDSFDGLLIPCVKYSWN
jgi:transposase-like protein